MWQRYRVRPSTAVGMLMAVGLLFMVLLGVALIAMVLWGLLSLVIFAWLRRRI